MISSLANSSTWPDVSHGLDFKCSKWLDPLLLMKQILRFQRFFSRDFMRVATSHGSHNLIPWKMATLSSVFWHSKPLRIKQSLNQNSGKKSWPVRSQTLRSKYVHVWFKWLMVLEMITECLQGPGVTCQEKVVPAIQRSIQNILCLQWRGLPGCIYIYMACPYIFQRNLWSSCYGRSWTCFTWCRWWPSNLTSWAFVLQWVARWRKLSKGGEMMMQGFGFPIFRGHGRECLMEIDFTSHHGDVVRILWRRY